MAVRGPSALFGGAYKSPFFLFIHAIASAHVLVNVGMHAKQAILVSKSVGFKDSGFTIFLAMLF